MAHRSHRRTRATTVRRLISFLFLLVPLGIAPTGRHAANGEDRSRTEAAEPQSPSRTPAQRGTSSASSPWIPDYRAFCDVALRHARWDITYARSQEAAPFIARHKADRVTMATSNVDLLDHVLTTYAAPPRARPYVDDTAQRIAESQALVEVLNESREVGCRSTTARTREIAR